LDRDEVQKRLRLMPRWLADLQDPKGIARFEVRCGAVLPASVRGFWQFPPLVCVLDAWQENFYLEEEPRLVWQNHLLVCSYPRFGELTAISLGTGDDPSVYRGDINGRTPNEMVARSFSEFILWSVLYKAKVHGELHDGAVHRAAGPGLLEECLKIGHCPPGEARITKGYLLPAKFIVHTVGPVWEGGEFGEREVLASCYRSALKLASEHGVETIAFPCIATGVYGYPQVEACDVAITTTLEWLHGQEQPQKVVFCCFADDDAKLYRLRLGAS
jgi:O-acetyl-ADP-ribose deacetylase (regulator of RNase III)